MSDVLLVAAVITFFVVAALFVAACDRIIGDDISDPSSPRGLEQEPELVASSR